MYSCRSILECYNLFSGVGLCMGLFCFIIIVGIAIIMIDSGLDIPYLQLNFSTKAFLQEH